MIKSINHPIYDLILDAFAAHDALINDDPISIRDMISSHDLNIMRCDLTDDIATLHLDLNDELHDLTMIAIFDRDDLTIRTLILNSDSSTAFLIND